MKLLSTFDWNYRKEKEADAREVYGEDNVFSVKKSKLFLWIKIILPLSFYTIILGLSIRLIIYRFKGQIGLYTIIFVVLLWLLPMMGIIKKYIDYTLDFIIITPHNLLRYDQTGILKRTSKTVDVLHIKTISVRRQGILYSLFNNGDIVVMTDMGGVEEGNDEGIHKSLGEIVFTYVKDPENTRKRIINKLNKSEAKR